MHQILICEVEKLLSDNIGLVLEFEGFTPIIGLSCEEAITLLEEATIHLLICNDETECDIRLIKLARERGILMLIPKLYAFRSRDAAFPPDLYLNNASIVTVLHEIIEKIHSEDNP